MSEPKSPELAAFVGNMLELIEVLHQDAAESLEFFRFGTHEFCVRVMVRALSAEFEARIYLLEHLLVGLNKATPDKFPLSSEEIQILKGQAVSIKKNGELTTSAKFHPFQERLLFTLKTAAKIINPAGHPDTSLHTWDAVQDFTRIRNRITHPKSLSDLEMSDKEIDQLNLAQDWIRNSLTAIFHAGGFSDALLKPPPNSPKNRGRKNA